MASWKCHKLPESAICVSATVLQLSQADANHVSRTILPFKENKK